MDRPVTTAPLPGTLLVDDHGLVHVDERGAAHVPDDRSLAALLAMRSDALSDFLSGLARDGSTPGTPRAPVHPRLEVWAAGVTYEVSREARVAESGQASVYERVYDADRPELFFKAPGYRVRGPGEPVGVRADSTWDVPEPELALVCNAYGEVVGYTICNDMSSRSIEGENPLYLPQAKCYRGSCAVGPWIRLASEVLDPYALGIEVIIERAGDVVWSGSTSTSRLHRTLDDLVDTLFGAEAFPDGVVLATGTGAVPPESVTLRTGDGVRIRIDGIGELRNDVRRGAIRR